jgi:hypothetical protein
MSPEQALKKEEEKKDKKDIVCILLRACSGYSVGAVFEGGGE